MFVRQDISLAHQIVQSNHAVLTIAANSIPPNFIPNIVLIGLPDVAALYRAQQKLKAAEIDHCAWVEPDGDLGFTAIATVALDGAAREVLKNYRLWCPIFPCSSNAERHETLKSLVEMESRVLPGEPILQMRE